MLYNKLVMKNMYLILEHDALGDWSYPCCGFLSKEKAETRLKVYESTAELEAKVDHPEDWQEFCDYYTIQEVTLYD